MECPLIDKSISSSKFNRPVNYKDLGGPVSYIFYDHNDGFGNVSRVQYCQQIGRKKDVFECLNENEWKKCRAYKLEILFNMLFNGFGGNIK